MISIVLAFQAGEYSGKWTKKSYSIDGTWTIKKSESTYMLVLDDDFDTKSAPDLKLFLSKKNLSELNDKNATSEARFIAELEDDEGEQSYKLPAGVNPTDYKTLIIHCEKYSVLWGGASLK